MSSIGLQLTTGEVSVRPYPCKVGNPIELRKVPISGSRAPPPDTNVLRLPPNCFFILDLTVISHILFIILFLKVSFSLLNFFEPSLTVFSTKNFFIPLALLKVEFIF